MTEIGAPALACRSQTRSPIRSRSARPPMAAAVEIAAATVARVVMIAARAATTAAADGVDRAGKRDRLQI